MSMRCQSRRIVVTGAGGRLGSAMVRELATAGHRVIALTRADLDVSNAAEVDGVISGIEPDAIVNCSAYNAVDGAETSPAAAFAANAEGPAALAAAATRSRAVLVHYSTDFVFDGNASTPYLEDSPTRPLSVYGASKLAGEYEVRATPAHYILRVESLFGGTAPPGQRATVDLIADKLGAGETVKAIVDRTVSPSYVPHVVRATTALLDQSAPFGIYHCVASGSTTWYELAEEIARLKFGSGKIIPVNADEFQTIAPRPRFCALSNDKLKNLGVVMPDWKSALREHLTVRALQQRDEGHSAVRVRTA
jgi:dTDP-4-dehydrorhamnose reductase